MWSSMAVMPDGMPVIGYYGRSNKDVKFAQAHW